MFLLTHTSGRREHRRKETKRKTEQWKQKERGEINCNSRVFYESQVGVLMHCTFMVALTLSGILAGLVFKRCLRKGRLKQNDFPFVKV